MAVEKYFQLGWLIVLKPQVAPAPLAIGGTVQVPTESKRAQCLREPIMLSLSQTQETQHRKFHRTFRTFPFPSSVKTAC